MQIGVEELRESSTKGFYSYEYEYEYSYERELALQPE